MEPLKQVVVVEPSLKQLKTAVADYLKSEGRDSALVAGLFTGVVERIVFLVSRIQGTFEFEVQPLREYFAARHLYDTAPYSPPGNERSGTKPDRFEAIAANLYWANVTRFYAGCYSKGELAGLVRQLADLRESELFKDTAYPARLSGMLLADWVFHQDQHATLEAVENIVKDLRLAAVAARRFLPHSAVDVELVLPGPCGRDELVREAFRALRSGVERDYAADLCDLIVANAQAETIDTEWLKGLRRGERLSEWITIGAILGSISRLEERDLRKIPLNGGAGARNARILLHAGHALFLEGTEDRFNGAAEALLDGMAGLIRPRAATTLERFARALEPTLYCRAYFNPAPLPLSEVVSEQFGFEDSATLVQRPEYKAAGMCQAVIDATASQLARDAAEWAHSLDPWETIVETARGEWGERWACFSLANVSAAIATKENVAQGADALLARDLSLCRRARYARLRPGASEWWRQQLQSAVDENERLWVHLVFLTWGGLRTILKHQEVVEAHLGELQPRRWRLLFRGLDRALYLVQRSRTESPGSDWSDEQVGPLLSAALSLRMSERGSLPLTGKLLRYDGDDKIVWSVVADAATRRAVLDSKQWGQALPVVERAYTQGADLRFLRQTKHRIELQRNLPVEVARLIVKTPEKYPSVLVQHAEAVCRRESTRSSVPVRKIAIEQHWF